MVAEQSSEPMQSRAQSYVFDNAGQPAQARLSGLSHVYDAGTIRHLTERGVGPGWRCLEVGAGGGTIARWLAEQVGADGFVLATDIDTRFLVSLPGPNLEVRRHDIATDPLPDAAFDVVHARLVLQHVPERDTALARLAAALKPGGWLVVEEFFPPASGSDAWLYPAGRRLKALDITRQVMEARGVDIQYGWRVPARLQTLGMSDIGAEGRSFRFTGGSPGSSVTRANMEQLREAILATGSLSEQEFEENLASLNDPTFAYFSTPMWAVWGRRRHA